MSDDIFRFQRDEDGNPIVGGFKTYRPVGEMGPEPLTLEESRIMHPSFMSPVDRPSVMPHVPRGTEAFPNAIGPWRRFRQWLRE